MVAEFQGQMPPEREGFRKKLYNDLGPSLGNPQYYFYYILFGEAVTVPTQERERRLYLLMGSGKFLEDHAGLEILEWAFLENTFCCSYYFT